MGKKKSSCNFKCTTCEHYDKPADFCKENKIKECSKQVHTDFSQCTEYLIRKDLVMF